MSLSQGVTGLKQEFTQVNVCCVLAVALPLSQSILYLIIAGGALGWAGIWAGRAFGLAQHSALAHYRD